MHMKRTKKSVKFTNKGYSRRGMISLALSAFSLVWLIVSVIRMSLYESSANLFGGIGMLALVLELLALIAAARALREEDVFRGIPKAAMAAAVLLLLLWAAIYGLGVYTMLNV